MTRTRRPLGPFQSKATRKKETARDSILIWFVSALTRLSALMCKTTARRELATGSLFVVTSCEVHDTPGLQLAQERCLRRSRASARDVSNAGEDHRSLATGPQPTAVPGDRMRAVATIPQAPAPHQAVLNHTSTSFQTSDATQHRSTPKPPTPHLWSRSSPGAPSHWSECAVK